MNLVGYSQYWNSVKEDMEEQRKIVEGADALLNLAGITTYNTRKRSLTLDEQRNVKQQCVEAMPGHRARLQRKEKAASVNCKESINSPSHPNDVFDDEDDVDGDEDDDSDASKHSRIGSIVEDKSRTLKSRATVTSSRRPRKKIEKKKFKM